MACSTSKVLKKRASIRRGSAQTACIHTGSGCILLLLVRVTHTGQTARMILYDLTRPTALKLGPLAVLGRPRA
eukprot:7658980-Pyramimonas_sp.AAC.1